MGVLETVFNPRKFDLNDDVLMEFNNYFDVMYLLMAMKLQIVKEKNQHTPMLFGLTQFCLFPK